MKKSTVFLYLAISFVSGIFLSSIFFVSQLFILGFLILGIILISVFWNRKKSVVVGFCLLLLVAGVLRHQQVERGIQDNELRKYNDNEKVVTLVGTVVREPDIRNNNTKLTVKTEQGKVLVTINRYPQYQYGDQVRIIGKLMTPLEFEDFNYKDYLAKEGIYSVLYWPQIELLERGNYISSTNIIYARILRFKDKLRESIYSSLSPPQSSILGAMILGDKRRMSDELKDKLNIAGVRHITAISGMHITILSLALMQIFLSLGFWRKHSFYLTLALLFLFIIMVGLPASGVRAGIFIFLFLFAQMAGRLKESSRAIVFAAALMLAVNPLLLLHDVGFQLSFLAVMGIIYLGPVIKKGLKIIPEEKFFGMRSIISMTLAAQIFTLPILVFNFGRISLIAPLTNALILPLLPYIFGLGFLFGIVGIVWSSLGQILSFPSWLLLTYLMKIVDLFSRLPFASLTIENVHWIWLIISFLVLGYIAWRLSQKQEFKILTP
ncbi:MAG: hypothetical protein CMI54_03185 [Parcubacteria group bacterium]|nr:hypothetical protein [Parcubacteria group bacterium]|tara:strand:- start:49811 stop:51289 length:1479 start_codon:yes stop_codon:yes gene_type:complete